MRLPLVTIRASVARDSAALNVRSLSDQSLPSTSSAQLRPAGQAGAWQTSTTFTTQSTSWESFAFTFEFRDTCVDCRLVMRIEQDSWTSYWGNQFFIGNFTLEQLEMPLQSVPEHHVS